ncbi:MAG: hypothetical protein MRERV_73c002 [Mycoplasmataceae bacterium RV_VA103A]|nr:MAG: hypothetical protein MRERV_73c002 [Mycoplasmataceae bacterium RV_VA103A]
MYFFSINHNTFIFNKKKMLAKVYEQETPKNC